MVLTGPNIYFRTQLPLSSTQLINNIEFLLQKTYCFMRKFPGSIKNNVHTLSINELQKNSANLESLTVNRTSFQFEIAMCVI